MKIDRNRPLDVCRIETFNYVKYKANAENISTNLAMQLVADETGIPFNTIKNWVYPTKQETKNINVD